MIDEDRLKHILAVARLMKDKANKAGLDAEEMFLLGMMHDIGYEFGGSEEHHLVGAGILEKQGYKYYLEVLFHGKPTDEYSSPALDLLNYADMHINKKGEYVSFEDRLEDIANRRGKDSPHYKNCKVIIDGLKSRNFLTNTSEPKQKQ